MGILDSKSRILDSIITREGRKQIVGGKLNVKFAAFSDRCTFYEADVVSGSADASKRVYFEAVSLPQDRITLEADDSGRLLSFEGRNFVEIKNGIPVISGSFLTDSSQFASTIDSLLTSSFDNFDELQIIGSNDFFIDDDEFRISEKRVSFSITEQSPIKNTEVQSIGINRVESFFQDKRLSHIDNFKYLPPRNSKTLTNPEGAIMGRYPRLNQQEMLTIDDVMSGLVNKESKTIYFSETSQFNNIFCQFFEVTQSDVKKLDVIDFGTFPAESGDIHAFFVGKIYVDGLGRATFVNLFTLLFE